jgi:hypothetical protein
VLRDRHGRLGTKAFTIRSGRTRSVRVHVHRKPARKLTARVLTLQPGGYVVASLRYRLGHKH